MTSNMKTTFPLLLVLAIVAIAIPAYASEAAGPVVKYADGSPAAQNSPIVFFANLMVWKWIAFGLLLVIMWFAVLPKMFGALRNRQTRIEEALAKAERVNQEAEALFAKHQKMMDEAHLEAKKINDAAVAGGQKARTEIVEAATKEAAEIVSRARKEIELAQNKALDELRSTAVELSLIASSAVLKRSLTGDDHRRLAQEAIAAIGRRN